MRDQDCFEIGFLWKEPDMVEWARRHAQRPGLHFSLVEKGEPLACGGVLDALPGVGTAWLVAMQAWTLYVRTVTRAFQVIAADDCYRRIQAYVNPTNEPAIRFVMWLGFEFEGECKRLAPNGDSMLLFAHTRR
jgi:hypothetical protein